MYFDDTLIFSTTLEKHLVIYVRSYSPYKKTCLSQNKSVNLERQKSCSLAMSFLRRASMWTHRRLKSLHRGPGLKIIRCLKFSWSGFFLQVFCAQLQFYNSTNHGLYEGCSFTWTKEADIAFAVIKKKLTSAPILVLRRFYSPFELHCDALKLGIVAVLSHHSLPVSIISNRVSRFIRHFWRSLWKLLKTSLNMSSVYHPQTDGQPKVINRSLGNMLRCMVGDNIKSWDSIFCQAEFVHNHAHNRSLGFNPFKVVYGFSL